MVHPPPSYGFQSTPRYSQPHLICQNPSPAYRHWTSQNYSASKQPSYATSTTVHYSELQKDYVQGSTGDGMPLRYSRSNIRAADKRSHVVEQAFGPTIVDGSRPTTLGLSTSFTSKPLSLANPISAFSSNFNRANQSSCSLWVGAVPRSANLLDLKDHFSQHAYDDIKSVFLLIGSNCAFVNYRSEAATAAALSRCHGSDFQGSRLVCKLQQGPSEVITNQNRTSGSCSRDEASVIDNVAPRSADRYFVMKSFTEEELEASQQSGLWVTQTHNEFKLNEAFEYSQQVYLVFSANKSGQYFGYARMLSAIDDNEIPKNLPLLNRRDGHQNGLDVTPTCATSVAPKGRIIRDFAKNVSIWVADSLEVEPMNSDIFVEMRGTEACPLGKPFRIQWLSHKRVPFHRTLRLRNPWNSNRLVKIARDGTEIEPTVARKLVQLFKDE